MSSTELEAQKEVLVWLASNVFSARGASMAAWTLLVYDHRMCYSLHSFIN